jgi:hypothetical protein
MKQKIETNSSHAKPSALSGLIQGGMFTVADIMRMTGFSRTPIIKEIKLGKLPAVSIGSQWCCTRSDLVAWVGEQRANELITNYQTKAA